MDFFEQSNYKGLFWTKKQLHETEVVNVTSNSNTDAIPENVIQISNLNNITEDVTVNSNTSSNSKQVGKSNPTVGDIKQDLLSMYEEKNSGRHTYKNNISI